MYSTYLLICLLNYLLTDKISRVFRAIIFGLELFRA